MLSMTIAEIKLNVQTKIEISYQEIKKGIVIP